jgi:hypothetical protein
MIVFISRNRRRLEIQDSVNIACQETMAKVRDLCKSQIFHAMIMQDMLDEKSISTLIEFFFRRSINQRFSFSEKNVSFFFRAE